MDTHPRQADYDRHLYALSRLFAYLARTITGGVGTESMPQALVDAYEAYLRIQEGPPNDYDPAYLPAVREHMEAILPERGEYLSQQSHMRVVLIYSLQMLASLAQGDRSQTAQAESKLIDAMKDYVEAFKAGKFMPQPKEQ